LVASDISDGTLCTTVIALTVKAQASIAYMPYEEFHHKSCLFNSM
jgi:hypothetical protein